MSASREFEPSTGELPAEGLRRLASEPDPGDEPTRFVAPASSPEPEPEPDAQAEPETEAEPDAQAEPEPDPEPDAQAEPETEPETEPEWLAPPPKRRRVKSGAFTVAFAAAALVIIGTLVAIAYLTSENHNSPAVAAAPSSSPSPRPSAVPPSRPPSRPPAGPDAVVESAQTIMDGFNKRDVALLQSVSCSSASVGTDIFAGIPKQVEYKVDGNARIAGATAKIHYVAVNTSSGDSNGGDMTMDWDGNRWCFASAGA